MGNGSMFVCVCVTFRCVRWHPITKKELEEQRVAEGYNFWNRLWGK